MRIKDPVHEAEEPYNLVPLTDMVFNLLIFFMAATTFAQVEKELGVQLPKATTFSTLSAAPRQLTINIDANGAAIVKRQVYSLPQLADLIGSTLKQDPNASVLIRADENGTVKHFAAVADVCKKAGVREAKIAYLSGAGAG